MKRYVVYINTILLVLIAILGVSCNNDDKVNDDYVEHVSYLTGTYSNYDSKNKNVLVLEYNGTILEKKEVSFYTSDNKIGKITFAHIIENEAETIIDKIPLELNEEEGRLYFKGIHSSPKGNYDYSGYITMGRLSLSISMK